MNKKQYTECLDDLMKYKDDIEEDKTLFFGRLKQLYNMTPLFDFVEVPKKIIEAVYYLMTEAMSIEPIGALTEQAYSDFLKYIDKRKSEVLTTPIKLHNISLKSTDIGVVLEGICNCGERIILSNFCPICGQALDWSDEQ